MPVKTVTCKQCQVVVVIPHGSARTPPGWLSVSVAVPEDVTTGSGKPYLWAGLYCCVACLLANGDDLLAAEDLAGWGQAS